MPRYTIGDVEIPVTADANNAILNPAIVAVAQADKDALKDAKDAAGGGLGVSLGSVFVVGGLLAGASWFLFGKKRGGSRRRRR